ncbi:hypothetical protein NUW54_g11349 [Trametes sanguinea]|uniref:Uncharacterized protein n=1 Tax=Trametes sanguinea TaxID=158606 RepID=A0ACC1NG99_9APHY|nr:hypothetical protein NUW54_g11349 [Trametes sanguinea]
MRGPSTSTTGGRSDVERGKPVPMISDRPSLEGVRTDLPQARERIRSICGLASLVFLAVVIMSIIAGVDYRKAVDSGEDASQVQVLRYASSGIVLFLLVCMICGALYAMAKTPRVPRGPAVHIVVLCVLLTVVAVYRLIVMRNWTTPSFHGAARRTPRARRLPADILPAWDQICIKALLGSACLTKSNQLQAAFLNGGPTERATAAPESVIMASSIRMHWHNEDVWCIQTICMTLVGAQGSDDGGSGKSQRTWGRDAQVTVQRSESAQLLHIMHYGRA